MTAAAFKAAMIQMRSGLAPAANVDAAVRMIGEAKSAGADYVLTPEMTNIMEVKRERLFATIVEEDADTSLATLRELARKLGIYIHVGSLAIKLSPDKAANRSFLIDPKGDDRRALRQDPHVRRRSRRRRELSRIAQLPAGRTGGAERSAVGPARTDDLLRPAFPGALPRAGGSRRHHADDPLRFHPADRRGALARADPRPRDRERLLRVRRRASRQARERPRDLRPFADRRSLGPRPGGRRQRAGGGDGRDRSWRKWRKRARESHRSQHGRRFEIVEPMAEPTHLHVVRGAE